MKRISQLQPSATRPLVGRVLLCSALVCSVFSATVLASEPVDTANPFELSADELSPIRYSRIDQSVTPAGTGADHNERETRLLFKLRPSRPDFSRKGGYGFGMLGLTRPEVSLRSASQQGTQPGDLVPDLHHGFSYSAGIKVEHEEDAIDGTAYVSSSLLGLSYGRLGRIWYQGIGVNLEQFNDDVPGLEQPTGDQLSVDFTTGRRLGFGGTSADAPLWLLSLQGNFDVAELERDDASLENSGEWYLNPSLFWQRPGFSFSAELQLPVEAVSSPLDEALPDYQLRAVFEKQF